jgi:hypothetical protein
VEAPVTSSFPIVGAIVALFLVVVVIFVVIIVLSRRSLSPSPKPTRDLDEIQRAAAADVAELREHDHYDPTGPGFQPEDDL